MKTEIIQIIRSEGVSCSYYKAPSLLFEVSLKDLKSFISVPWHISWYRSEESRKIFPPILQEYMDLNPDFKLAKRLFPGYNPFFTHLEFLQYYIAYTDGTPSGRIAALIDKNYHEKKFDGKIGIIGLFEAQNAEVGEALIEKALEDLKRKGALKIIGPMRFNASGEAGLLIDGFSIKPMTMEPYNPPYYKEILEQYGKRENDWFSFFVDSKTVKPYVDRISNFSLRGENLENFVLNNGIRIREVTLKDFKEEIENVKKIYNLAWDTIEHPQFEKFTDEEFRYIANTLKSALIPEFVFIVEEKISGTYYPIGVSVTIPNVNELIEKVDSSSFKNFLPSASPFGVRDISRDIRILNELKDTMKKRSFKTSRIFILGIIKKKMGLDALLYKKTFENSINYGIEYSSASQIADTNLNMVNPLLRMGKIGYTWRVYRFH